MPKAISIPEPIPKQRITAEGTIVTITEARVVREQYTTIGTMKLGLGLTVEIGDDEYSAIFSLDKETLSGSVGRVLTSVGLTSFTDKITDEDVSVLTGKQYRIVNRNGKLYWYPTNTS